MTLMDRFMKYVSPEPNSGCWLWLGAVGSYGHGQFSINRKARPAHRIAYEAAFGAVPAGLELDHLCRVPCCVNPRHLEAVTHRENMLRSPIAGPAANRRKTHCPYGHPYDEGNTYRDKLGKRTCRECWTRRRSARAIL